MALSAADISRLTAEQTQLRTIRANGATEIITDGVKVVYASSAEIDKRLRDIARALNPSLRPRMAGINLGRAW